MKRTKRLLSTLLALCMVLAMLPATALAASVEGTGDGNDPSLLPTERYTVLVLDHSGSMRDGPIEQMKIAAQNFCTAVEAKSGEKNINYVAVLGFSTTPDAGSEFVNVADVDAIAKLNMDINRLQATNLTDISAALIEADSMLTKVGNSREAKKVVKNIILLSDGLPETSYPGESGRYDEYNHWAVRQANRCYNEVDKNGLRERWNVYTLGFFHGMSYYDAAFCGKVLTDLQTDGFYEVQNADDLTYIFRDVLPGEINGAEAHIEPTEEFNTTTGNRVVIRIACPVDVEVTVRGKVAKSTDANAENGYVVPVGENNGVTGTYGKIVVSNPPDGENGTTKTITLRPNYNYTLGLTASENCKVSITTTVYDENNNVVADKTEERTLSATQRITTTVTRDGTTYTTNPNDDQVTKSDAGRNYFTFVPTTVGGTVVLSKRNAEPGDWVNIYVTPDEGYELASITVTDQRGWPVTLREMGENAYSFTMPNARINVNPVFVKTEEPAGDYKYPINVPEVNNSGAPGYGAMVINPGAMNYSDVNAGDWFYDNVKFVHERYLMTKTGEADGTFEPNTSATRASIWVALSRMAGRNTINQGDNWYDRAQVWAKGKGITDGERPMGELTREEFVTMLWRYNGNKYVSGADLNQFNDGESVSWWAAEAVKWAVANNLLKGDNGSLNPQNNVTRAEVAAVLQRYIQNVH